MTTQNDYAIDKAWIRKSFDHAANTYDKAAILQREVANRMLERLDYVRIAPKVILDVGSGTGYCSRALVKRFPKAKIISLDIAHGMLQFSRAQRSLLQRVRNQQSHICADAESLPLANNSIDLIWSSLSLQWCESLDSAFREFRRVLKSDGLLMFSSLGPDTLRELRTSWGEDGGQTHVSAFIDMHDVGDALMRARFADPVMDMEHIVLTYPSVNELMRDLKQLGSRNATQGRARGLTGKRQLQAMKARYERFRDHDGLLPATYEVTYGHAWIPQASQQPSSDDTGGGREFVITLDQIQKSTPR